MGADCGEGGGQDKGAVHGQVQAHCRDGQEEEGGQLEHLARVSCSNNFVPTLSAANSGFFHAVRENETCAGFVRQKRRKKMHPFA
jgi:hypothetical protein